MNRILALLLISVTMLGQPVPHVHAGETAQRPEHVHNKHVHVSGIFGGHSHATEATDRNQDRDSGHDGAQTPVDHDSDAVFVGDWTATVVRSDLGLPVVPWFSHSLEMTPAVCLDPVLTAGNRSFDGDRSRLSGSVPEVPFYLQGSTFRS